MLLINNKNDEIVTSWIWAHSFQRILFGRLPEFCVISLVIWWEKCVEFNFINVLALYTRILKVRFLWSSCIFRNTLLWLCASKTHVFIAWFKTLEYVNAFRNLNSCFQLGNFSMNAFGGKIHYLIKKKGWAKY